MFSRTFYFCLMVFRWVQTSFVKRSANNVAHGLARWAKDLVEDIVWIEDSPPPVMEALLFDSAAE